MKQHRKKPYICVRKCLEKDGIRTVKIDKRTDKKKLWKTTKGK
jgi:hypothetical protein